MARSANIYTGDGSTTQFAVNFTLGFISRGDVQAYVEGELDGSLQQIYRTITWINDGLIELAPAPAVGKKVYIRRVMNKAALQHDYQDGAIQNEQAFDESNLQLLYIIHEILDGFVEITDNSDLAAAISTAQAAAVVATDKATIATTQAGIAETAAATATAQAGIATAQAVIATTQAGIATAAAAELVGAMPKRNRIINGCFRINQGGGAAYTATAPYGSGSNNNDRYTLDRWYILSDGNDIIDVAQENAVVPPGCLSAIRLDVETINKKFGIAQIIAHEDIRDLFGEAVTFSFMAKVSSTTKLSNVKAAIVSWTGTADVVTSNIISAWNGAGTNPTLIANAVFESEPVNLGVTTDYAQYSITATLDAVGAKNVIVFIWSDVVDTTLGDFLYAADASLKEGTAGTVIQRSLQEELLLCRRFAYALNNQLVGIGYAESATEARVFVPFTTRMRATPQLLHGGGNSSQVHAPGIAAQFANAASLSLTADGVMLAYSCTGLTIGRGCYATIGSLDSILLSAEL